MDVQPLAIPDVKLLTPRRFGDDRGYFYESWSRRLFADIGLDRDFVQDNMARSRVKGVVRGLHFQQNPNAQAKLVSVLQGAVLDVAVDVRHGSPTYGRHVAVELTAENGRMMLVPRGFAHGYVTLTEDTIFHYKVDGFYSPADDRGIYWADPALGIDWGVGESGAVLSDKDKRLPMLADLAVYFRYGA
jgi:dTDP-4-dehydrorhamnose 3,5-epimerase